METKKQAKEILNKYIKGDIFRDYDEEKLKTHSIFLSTALKAMVGFSKEQNLQLIEKTTSQEQTIERHKVQLKKLWACNVAFFQAMNDGTHTPELSKQLNKEIIASQELLNTAEQSQDGKH